MKVVTSATCLSMNCHTGCEISTGFRACIFRLTHMFLEWNKDVRFSRVLHQITWRHKPKDGNAYYLFDITHSFTQCCWTHLLQRTAINAHNLIDCVNKTCTLYTVHSVLDIVHCALCTVQCALYTVHCALHTVHCTLYTVHCALYNVHFTLHTVHCTLYTVHCAL